MTSAICLLSALCALLVAALPAGTTVPEWRGAPIILSFLLLGWSLSQVALFSALALGFLLEALAHLPPGTIAIPGILLTVTTTLLRPRLQRQQLAIQIVWVGLMIFLFEAGLNAWQSFHGLPVAETAWLSPLLAVLLWGPLSLLITPPDTAL